MKLSISPAITTRDLRILGTSSALRNRLRRATIQMCTWVGNEQSVESDGGLVSRSWGSFTGSSGRGNTPVVAFEVSLYVEKGVTVKEPNWNQAKSRLTPKQWRLPSPGICQAWLSR